MERIVEFTMNVSKHNLRDKNGKVVVDWKQKLPEFGRIMKGYGEIITLNTTKDKTLAWLECPTPEEVKQLLGKIHC